jgi:kynurenine formamidase
MTMNASPITKTLEGYDLVDLSHALDDSKPGANKRFIRITWMTPDMRDGFNAAMIFVFEHAGTHVDAPIHLAGVEGSTVEKIPLEKWVGDCLVLDVRGKEANGLVSLDEVKAWEAVHGEINEDDLVLFDFGWPSGWHEPDPEDKFSYRGDPGLSVEAARYLVEKKVKLVGSDVPNLDASADKTSPAHRALLDAHVAVLETMTNLERLPPRGSFLIALPLNITEGSGSPVRAVAYAPRA